MTHRPPTNRWPKLPPAEDPPVTPRRDLLRPVVRSAMGPPGPPTPGAQPAPAPTPSNETPIPAQETPIPAQEPTILPKETPNPPATFPPQIPASPPPTFPTVPTTPAPLPPTFQPGHPTAVNNQPGTQPDTQPANQLAPNIEPTEPAPIEETKPAFTLSSPASSSPLTLEMFRCLLGIPQEAPPLPRKEPQKPLLQGVRRIFSPVRRHNHIPNWLKLQSCHPEAATSTYFAILKEESHTWREFFFYETFVNAAMIIQLIIAAILVILGAMKRTNHVPISTLAAVTGVITGILNMIARQGLPNRLLQYADQLRRVREDIEWCERILRTDSGVVTYSDCVALREAYEKSRNDSVKNHPDTWTTSLSSAVGTKSRRGAGLGGSPV
ncbi:hypothetical protein EJ08DRAFT_695115 [Tothia fuscella]|uniref:SMODS and SLOG-associating 2TM effector domain-containing protein n=1 Tax=Tothia fuscella TaxID=1048955 RepID=A0A9P4NVY6_9PEZI|nr:hypothetical protein EJ08DRAFT_695115 [Tothia fuscella]